MKRSHTVFHGTDVFPSPPDKAFFHIIPVSFESSVSYGAGTAQGPEAILNASAQLECFDGKSLPCERGIYTASPVDCTGDTEHVLERIAGRVGDSLDHNALPVVIGGEHTVTLGSVRSIKKRGTPFGLIQLDAHADLRDCYEDNRYSHACVMRRVLEMNVPLFQIGTRSYAQEEAHVRADQNVCFYDAECIAANGIESVQLPPDFPEKIFLTVDIDVLDSGIMPATGTPVPGGLDWYQTLWIIETLCRQRSCIGFDLVEFTPIQGFHGYSFTAAQLIYSIMGIIERRCFI